MNRTLLFIVASFQEFELKSQKMKFKARITKDNLVVLLGVIQTFEKIAGNATVYLDETSVRISLLSELLDAPKCFAELNAQDLFDEYRIESLSSNTIFFEVSLIQLSRALASGKVASNSLLKLAKRENRPCLCFETKADESILGVDVVHNIPLKLMKSTDVVHYLPPQLPPPTVALDIPKGRLLKTIVDKLSKFAKHVQITASQSGKLALRADHPSVCINTYYSGLFARYVGELQAQRDINNQVLCKLNLRKLSMVLNLHNVPVDHATFCKLLHFILTSRPFLRVSFYIPVLV